MKLDTVVRVATSCLSEPRLLLGGKRHLLLLSHMRSYSSLLAHILGSHPEIWGHSERLQTYEGGRDLLKWRCEEYRAGSGGSYRYLVDKILHNGYGVSDSLLARADVRTVIFVREPKATLSSIVRLGRRLSAEASDYLDFEWVHGYYARRLDRLVHYARVVGERALFFDASALVRDTDPLLTGLGDWLGLTSPLRRTYTVFPDTGAPMKGDPSDSLKSGSVLPETPHREDVEFPAELVDSAEEHHLRCRQELLDRCRGLPPSPTSPLNSVD